MVVTKSPTLDMTVKKKLIGCLFIVIIFVWLISFKTNNTDVNQLDNMKESIDEYKLLLSSTREQILDRLKVCRRSCPLWDSNLPVIYVITPTYARPVQKAELTRLSQTLMLVQNIHWIIVEDSQHETVPVENVLIQSGLNYTQLYAPTPDTYKRKPSEPNWNKPRGVIQRNTALRWLRRYRNEPTENGVIYFADDDNTYNIQIFEEMRYTKEVSVWPVGLVGGLMVEKPLLNKTNGKVIGFNSAWRPDRPFPIDMAGFAINLQHFLKHPNAEFSYNVDGGFQESVILSKLTTRDRLEPKADNCTKILVWHTRTEAPRLAEEVKLKRKGLRSSHEGMEV